MLDNTAEQVDDTTDAGEHDELSTTTATLFDIRTVIGGLFLVYGVLIGGAGLFPSSEGLQKSQGININLWTGLAMLAVGGLFLLWLRLRPLTPQARIDTST